MTTIPLTEQQLAHWKRRALQAEAVVHFALWMRPLGPHWSGREPETADQLCTRFRAHVEDRYPEQITRYAHQRIEVLELAELCGCPEDADDWEEFHGESGENGHTLCSKKVLGHVCDSCKDEEGEGPAWLPYAVAWPCPPIAALDQPAAPTPTTAPLAASHGPAGDRDGETGTESAAGREADPLPAEDFTGTRPCGHDDYHDPHEWADRPDLWCPGHGYDDQAVAEEQPDAATRFLFWDETADVVCHDGRITIPVNEAANLAQFTPAGDLILPLPEARALRDVLAAVLAEDAVVSVAGQPPADTGEEARRCAHTDIVYGQCVRPVPHDGDCFHQHQPIRIDEETDEDSLCGSERPGDENFAGQLCGLPKDHFGDHRRDEEIAGTGHTALLRWRNTKGA